MSCNRISVLLSLLSLFVHFHLFIAQDWSINKFLTSFASTPLRPPVFPPPHIVDLFTTTFYSISFASTTTVVLLPFSLLLFLLLFSLYLLYFFLLFFFFSCCFMLLLLRLIFPENSRVSFIWQMAATCYPFQVNVSHLLKSSFLLIRTRGELYRPTNLRGKNLILSKPLVWKFYRAALDSPSFCFFVL